LTRSDGSEDLRLEVKRREHRSNLRKGLQGAPRDVLITVQRSTISQLIYQPLSAQETARNDLPQDHPQIPYPRRTTSTLHYLRHATVIVELSSKRSPIRSGVHHACMVCPEWSAATPLRCLRSSPRSRMSSPSFRPRTAPIVWTSTADSYFRVLLTGTVNIPGTIPRSWKRRKITAKIDSEERRRGASSEKAQSI
jgi:hypothetical protein